MTDYVSLGKQLDRAAEIVIEHDALDNMDRAYHALRCEGFTSTFVGVLWEEINDRARDIHRRYSKRGNVLTPTQWSVH